MREYAKSEIPLSQGYEMKKFFVALAVLSISLHDVCSVDGAGHGVENEDNFTRSGIYKLCMRSALFSSLLACLNESFLPKTYIRDQSRNSAAISTLSTRSDLEDRLHPEKILLFSSKNDDSMSDAMPDIIAEFEIIEDSKRRQAEEEKGRDSKSRSAPTDVGEVYETEVVTNYKPRVFKLNGRYSASRNRVHRKNKKKGKPRKIRNEED